MKDKLKVNDKDVVKEDAFNEDLATPYFKFKMFGSLVRVIWLDWYSLVCFGLVQYGLVQSGSDCVAMLTWAEGIQTSVTCLT